MSSRLATPITIVDVLRRRAAERPDDLAYRFLEEGEGSGITLTYGELDLRARAIAAFLRARYSADERILLLFPSGLEYITALFGCLYAGVIAVPAYPQSLAKMGRGDARLCAIASDCEPIAALGPRLLVASMTDGTTLEPVLQRMQWHAVDDLDRAWADEWATPPLDASRTAFLQYTSGSTAAPRGVMVTHANLLHNEELIRRACNHTAASTFVGWLPFYHDMGLVGNILQPLYLGSASILLPPSAFLQKPACWLRAITRFQGCTSGGPNFAYDLCVRRINDEERATLDLRSWTIAFNGAEPIRSDTLDRFARAFAPCGFRREAFYPCYGLAEATLMVSAAAPRTSPVVRQFDAQAFDTGHARPVDAETGETRTTTLVSSGRPVDGQEVAIIDPHTRLTCDSGAVGEVWVAGASIAQGYWNRQADTEATFRATRAEDTDRTWLRTGDLGFLHEGELFVAGRLKDLIIVRGRNIFPQDLELTAERSHPALRPGGGAAFAIDADDEERVIIVHEVDRAHVGRPLEEVAQTIGRAIVANHQIEPHAIVLIGPGQLPKTSSGKVRRGDCRRAFEAQRFEVLTQVITTPSNMTPDIAVDEEWMSPGERHMLAQIEASVVGRIRRALARLLRTELDETIDDRELGALGLDSLRIAELRHAVEAQFHVNLPATLRFDTLRVGDLMRIIVSQQATPAAPAPPAIVHREGARHDTAISDGQRGLWLLHQIAPDTTATNICRAIRVRGPLRPDVLQRVAETLHRRHAVLASTFRAGPEAPVRVDVPSASWFEIMEATLTSAELAARLDVEAAHRFALDRGPLFRLIVLEQGQDDHVLVVNAHHSVADLWSVGILLRELLRLYAGAVARPTAGLDALLEPLAIDYADYVQWHAGWLRGPEGERQADYWARQFAGGIRRVTRRLEGPRRARTGVRAATREFEVARPLMDALRARARSARTTLFSSLLAILGMSLYRETGQEDLVIGVPCSGRTHAALRSLVGYFVNLLPIRLHVADDLTIDRLMHAVHADVQEALAHQDYPFTVMVECIAGLRDVSGWPSVNVMFGMQSFPQAELEALTPLTLGLAGGELQAGDLTLSTLPLRQQGAQFDLELLVAEHEGRLMAVLDYNADAFDDATIDRVVRGFQTLIEQVGAWPEVCVGGVGDFARPASKQIETWNRTERAFKEPETLVGCLEAAYARVPQALAVADESRTLTYAALHARANQLARVLRGRGAGPEAVVAVCLERGVDLEVALLAILKTGAAYLPLDPSDPPLRLRGMLEDSRAILAITHEALARRLECPIPTVILDRIGPLLDREDPSALGVELVREQMAYVIYTSGSTGRPKGVVNTQAGLRNRLLWMQHVIPLGPQDRVLQKTPYTFDVSVWEFFWPLLAGAEVVMARPAGHKDTSYLAELLRSQRITTVHFVPSQLRLLLREPGLTSHALRRIICSGEVLDDALQDECLSRLPDIELYNLYGPTEAAIDVTAWRCRRGQPVSIGRPIANITAHVLNEQQLPVPPGVAGELCLGGIGLARGYLHRPDLTAERFIPHPLDTVGGERLYRTGDRAAWTEQGTLRCFGRLDRQVKIRGARVELGDVEAALQRLPEVRAAAVDFDSRAGEAGELTAYVVPVSAEASVSWRQRLRDHLPDYMIPTRVVTVDALPCTPSGKLDRHALRDMPLVPPPTRDDAPRTPLEEQLARIWAEVLKRPRVGIHDNFFDLGGHSLLATQLVSRIRDQIQCEIPVALIFSDGTTVAQLAEAMEAEILRRTGSDVAAALISRVLTASDTDIQGLLVHTEPS
jgi:amino acid adenylation domain-containing protein